MPRFRLLQDIEDEPESHVGDRRSFEISRNSGNISDKSIVCKDERSSREAGLDRDEDVMAVDGKVLVPKVLHRENLVTSRC